MRIIKNIKELHQVRDNSEIIISGNNMNVLPLIEDAWLAIKDGLIEDFGKMETLDPSRFQGYEVIDASGKMVLPTWADSHTHLVFAAPRNEEFEDRIAGKSYQEIAARGGGILNSAQKLSEMDETALYEDAKARLHQVIQQGTGAIEIKSGYGLSLEAELKMLRVIRRLKENDIIPIKSTFLGAHAVPAAFKDNKTGYVHHIINEMIPAVAREGLADYIDVFCEKGYFDLNDTSRILEAGIKRGLKPKVHVNQFKAFGGIKVCTEHNAVSVDHLEVLGEGDIQALANSKTIATALPSCSFFLSIPYTPVHELMAADIPVALATDFNPGSTPSGNMNFVFSLACIKMKMTPQQAINALTLNGAAAMELSNEVGSITKGKRANLILTKAIPGLSYLPYAFGESHIDAVMINGEIKA